MASLLRLRPGPASDFGDFVIDSDFLRVYGRRGEFLRYAITCNIQSNFDISIYGGLRRKELEILLTGHLVHLIALRLD